MAPLVLEGATLGRRHQHYNQILKDATSRKTEAAKVDYTKTDIENIFNIDVASNNRDLEYILEVLKGEDMLYISRAIKKSTWLFTEMEYAHIINPEYLHSELFPQMMPKASCHLLLHIRLTLKDESRVDEFFHYFEHRDLKKAFKWLPNCSVRVAEEAVKQCIMQIPDEIFGRLCQKSPTILGLLSEARNQYHFSTDHFLKAAIFLLNTDTELYLDICEKGGRYDMPAFTKKHTEIVMKKCPQRIIDNFEKYIYCIHLDTFAKSVKKDEIKKILLTQFDKEELRNWFYEDKHSCFMKYMSKEDKLEVIKKCIEKTISDISKDDSVRRYRRGGCTSNYKIYHWYKHAPFDEAFTEIKKLIRAESNPDERNAMLMILVENARKNVTHLQTLLQHYRERHINEPFRFKVQFVNELLQKTDTQLYTESIWSILDELFRSMEVYVESENNVQTCIKAIIAYNVTHNQQIPAIIEQKFTFDFLKCYERKLKGDQREKVFSYLFNLLYSKLDKHDIYHEAEFGEYVHLLKQCLDLLTVWKKELPEDPIFINKIKDCIKIKKEKGFTTSLVPLYHIKTSWKRILFEDSLSLSPSENVCINALKHDPELFIRHKDVIETLRHNDSARITKVLRKLRIYWPQTIASEWTEAYREQLNRPGGHKALVRGLYCLLNQQQVLEFLNKYKPEETKINWADADELQLSLRKNIAHNMHIARPQVTPDAILWYAKGDYVQFTQSSLNSILYNLRSTHSRECVVKLLNGIVSLEKHAIHLAFAKLSTLDMKNIFEDVWKTTKNSTLRAVIFKTTNNILCKEQDQSLIAEVWQLLQNFIDSLSADEDRTIYNAFGKLAQVHFSIKPAYCMKSYKFLKSLPPKVDCESVLIEVKGEIGNFIEELDPDFVTNVIEDFVNEVLLEKCYQPVYRNDLIILGTYLLCAVDESDQIARFNKVLVPLMNNMLASWDKLVQNEFIVKENLREIIEHLNRSTDYVLLNNKANPSSLYISILNKLEITLPTTHNFVLFRHLKLSAAFVDVLYKNKSAESSYSYHALYPKIIEDLMKVTIQYLKEDIAEYDSLIYRPFARALEQTIDYFEIDSLTKLKIIKHLLAEKDFVPICLVAIEMLPTYFYNDSQNCQKLEAKVIPDMVRSHLSPVVHVNYFMKFGSKPLPVDIE